MGCCRAEQAATNLAPCPRLLMKTMEALCA